MQAARLLLSPPAVLCSLQRRKSGGLVGVASFQKLGGRASSLSGRLSSSCDLATTNCFSRLRGRCQEVMLRTEEDEVHYQTEVLPLHFPAAETFLVYC